MGQLVGLVLGCPRAGLPSCWVALVLVGCMASRAHCTMPRHLMSVGAARPSKQWAYSGSAGDPHEGRPSLDEMTMTSDELAAWRRGERERLIAAREALDAATVADLRRRLDAHLERS